VPSTDLNARPDPNVAFAVGPTRVTGRRIIAHLADGVVLGFLFAVAVVAGAAISSFAMVAAIVFMAIPGQVLYYVLTQRRDGKSPGKRLTGIRVVDAQGQTPTTGNLLRRTLPLLIEYLYVIAYVSIISSAYRQRLGDRWAHTYVVDDTAPQTEPAPTAGARA
jgi:uncharacterized RDD family membrane protein YckC